MKDVVQKKVIKWLVESFVYIILQNKCVSPVTCMPKNGGMTVIPNEKNEFIPTRTVKGWRICMDYK